MRRILIIDDDEGIRELYKYFFTNQGYEVETAESGSDGLEKASVFNPDCMLLDILMPGITGAEFAREPQPHTATIKRRNFQAPVRTAL